MNNKIKKEEILKPEALLNMLEDLEKAKRQAEEHERKFKNFFEGQPTYCYMISYDGKILDINSSALKVLGYKKNELVGKPVKTIYAPEVYGKMKRLFNQWKKTGIIKNEEMVIISKIGKRRNVLLNTTSTKNEKIPHSISVQIDITERKKAEKALKESEEKYRVLAEASPNMIYLIDRKFRIVYINPIAAKPFGVIADKLIGKNLNKVFTPEMVKRHIKAIKRIFETGNPLYTKLYEKFPKGNFWIDARLVPVKDNGGKVTAVLGVSTDITSLKKSEEKLKELSELNKEIIEKLPIGVYRVNHHGKVDYVNPAMIEISKTPRNKFIGLDVFRLPTYKKIGLHKKIRDVFKGRSFEFGPVEYTSYFGKKKTTRIFLGVPIVKEGKIIKAIVVVEDLTKIKSRENYK